MSKYYRVFAEAKINGVWTCINGFMIREKDGETVNTCVYESRSSRYFEETEGKLFDLGQCISYSDLSWSLRDCLRELANSEDVFFIATPFYAVVDCIPMGKTYEYSGFVAREDVIEFESGEADELFTAITARDYGALDRKARLAYQYYEWDNPTGWFKHLKQIVEHSHWIIKDWEYINDSALSSANVRLVMVVE